VHLIRDKYKGPIVTFVQHARIIVSIVTFVQHARIIDLIVLFMQQFLIRV
jgi:hypothetical protein